MNVISPSDVRANVINPTPTPTGTASSGEQQLEVVQTCSRCAELEAKLEQVQVAKEDDAWNFAQELTRKLQEIGRLKTQLDEVLNTQPTTKLAKSLFVYWRDTLGKRPNTVYGTARKKAILKALQQHDEATIKRAIDGAKVKPFVGPHGRQATDANGAKRFDDLTLILRDETTIERFAGYAE